MSMNVEECVQIILLKGNWHQKEPTIEIHRDNNKGSITHSSLSSLLSKFVEKGSLDIKKGNGRRKSSFGNDRQVAVLDVARNPRKSRSVRRLSSESEDHKGSIHRVLRVRKWHPYKLQLQQKLSEDDPDRRLQFCEWTTWRNEWDPSFPFQILFSDVAAFYVDGEVNRQNTRYVHQTEQCHSTETGTARVMVWCGIWKDRIIGPFFFNQNLNGDSYVRMLEEEVFPSILEENDGFPTWFQHNGTLPHYSRNVGEFLNKHFPGQWIGRRGAYEWPSRSPDLTPLNFYLWGHLKERVYSQKIGDVHHLHQRISEACQSITPEMIQRVLSDWISRLHLCIDRNGQHVEAVL